MRWSSGCRERRSRPADPASSDARDGARSLRPGRRSFMPVAGSRVSRPGVSAYPAHSRMRAATFVPVKPKYSRRASSGADSP